MKKLVAALAACALLASACSRNGEENGASDGPAPYDSRYEALPSGSTLLTGATVLTGTGERLDDTDILLVDGRIAEIGSGLSAADAEIVDATGKWVTPGVIDVHSHLGVYPSPGTTSHSDGNEMSAPVTE